jgi:hypothetical protein
VTGWVGVSWAADLIVLLLASTLLRVAYFSGFIGGDDVAYADLVRQVLNEGYPAVGANIFASRPVLILALSASIRVFGWSEWAFVLPFVIASLACITASYVIARLSLDRLTGWIAAAAISVLPLDAVYATTATNDIVASACLSVGAVVTMLAFRRRDNHPRLSALIAGLGGALVGLGAGVKLSMTICGLAIVLISVVLIFLVRGARRVGVALTVGWFAAHALLAVFFAVTSGEPLASYRVEFGFNRTYMLDGYLLDRMNALLMYPRIAFALQSSGPVASRLFPYGLFFPLLIGAIPLALRWNLRGMWWLAIWCVSLILILEFWPLQLFPYVPIHRLPRLMHVAVVPGAVMIACALREGLRRGVTGRVIATSLMTAYMVTALQAANAASAYFQDCMLDMRAAAVLAQAHDGPVVTDAELRGYLMFKDGFVHNDKFKTVLGGRTAVPRGALVIFGGSRRVDMDPAWIAERVPVRLPPAWIKIADLPGEVLSWRRWRGAAFLATTDAEEIVSRGVSEIMGPVGCPERQTWHLIDVIDVGDVASERRHGYAIADQTFSGERVMGTSSNLEYTDDGRAFRGSQSFNTSLAEGADVCVVKRIDPSVPRQLSRWTARGVVLGHLDVRAGNTFGRWPVVTLLIPGSLAHGVDRLTEEFVSADVDVNAFRIELYQPAAIP